MRPWDSDGFAFKGGYIIRPTPTPRPVRRVVRPTRTCPACGHALDYHDGPTARVERDGETTRQNFFACPMCAHCEAIQPQGRR